MVTDTLNLRFSIGSISRTLVITTLCAMLSACGYKGPLYFPDEEVKVEEEKAMHQLPPQHYRTLTARVDKFPNAAIL